MTDLADAPSLVCMAIEQTAQNGGTIGDTMSRILDQWERDAYLLHEDGCECADCV